MEGLLANLKVGDKFTLYEVRTYPPKIVVIPRVYVVVEDEDGLAEMAECIEDGEGLGGRVGRKFRLHWLRRDLMDSMNRRRIVFTVGLTLNAALEIEAEHIRRDMARVNNRRRKIEQEAEHLDLAMGQLDLLRRGV